MNLTDLFKSRSRAERLYKQGNKASAAALYMKNSHFEEAARIYAEIGEYAEAAEAHDRAGQTRAAATLLLTNKRPKEAVPYFEKIGAYREAADACRAFGAIARAARLYEQGELYLDAADAYAEAGESDRLLRAWQRASEKMHEELKTLGEGEEDPALRARVATLDRRRAEKLEAFGRFLDAAALRRDLGDHAHAALLFEKGQSFSRAAEAYLDADRPYEALEALRKTTRSEAVREQVRAEIYQRTGEYNEAGSAYEALGQWDKAAEAYEDASEWERAAGQWRKADLFERAAGLYERAKKFDQAGECFSLAGRDRRAGDAYRNAKDFTAAAAAYETASEHLAAARCYRENNDPKAARRSLKEVASDHADYGLASLMLIDLLIEEGSFDGALYRLRELETAVTAMDEETRARVPDVDLRYWRGRIQEAKGEHAQAAVAYEQVISMSGDARDASRRLGEMRKWLHESQRLGGTARRGRHASGAHAPVAAGAAHSAGPSDETSTGEIQLAALAAAAQLPFVRGEAIEPPWWPDCTLQRAIDQRTNQPVEVLSLPLPSGVVWDAFERIRPGVRALDHPAILRLQEVVLADGRAHFAFSPFGGTPLGERLNGPRRPGAGQVLKMLMELADAIATAHHLGVQHGWLSPLTVLIDDDDRIRLVGFGMRDLVPADSTTLIAYLAPEVRDGLPLGPAADLYGLGLLGIELLNAHLPLDWSESASINPGDVFWPEEFDDVVPDAVRTVLLRCLARNPMARPSSADLKLALAAIGLVEGQVLMDRFEIRDELGRGGMSRVYRAFDRNLHDEVAIKTLLSPSGAHSEDAERLLREVQICRKISHPNVVRVHDMGYFPGGIFISMELLDGPGLDTIIKRKAPLPLAYTQRVLREVAEALGEAHRLNIVHRDLKPGNVMIADGRAKVMDFGIARIDDGNSNHLTRTGEVIGSPLYMAPEQIQGRPLDGTCDLYALGVIAFTMLAGREPFLGDSATEVVLKHINEKPPEIRSFRPDLPRSWVDMIARLLAKRPAKRYPSAAALIEALDRLPTEAF